MLGPFIDLLRFLLVVLNMAAILGEPTKSRRRKLLTTVATGGVALGDVYGETLRRIREQNDGLSRLGMQSLMWVSHSQRPLKIDELCHALAVELESADLDPDDAPSVDTLLDSCLGLVIIDKEKSAFRLIHYSLQEYLSGQNIFPRGHQTLAENCLTCLNFSEVNDLSVGCTPDLRYTSFLEYSSVYWGTHAKMQLSDSVKKLALKLLNRYDNHISAKLLLVHDEAWQTKSRARSPFTGLHCACRFGIVELVTYLIEVEGCKVSKRDFTGRTPLIWAAENAHDAVVKLLLERDDVDPNEPDADDATPLWIAAARGYKGVVKLLLARDDVNPNIPSKYGITPLLVAAESGNEGVVKLLLGRDDIDPNQRALFGETPLSRADKYGYQRVVESLSSKVLLAPGDKYSY